MRSQFARHPLAVRSRLRDGGLEWLDTGDADVLAFRRPNGWTSVTDFGDEPVGLPGATTAWLQA